MGLFGGNKKRSDLKKQKNLLTAYDRMEYFFVQERSDEELFKICDIIINGKPVLAKFDNLNASDCNYMLAFIAGVVYANAGRSVRLGPKLFLFARGEEFSDGSLEQYIEDAE